MLNLPIYNSTNSNSPPSSRDRKHLVNVRLDITGYAYETATGEIGTSKPEDIDRGARGVRDSEIGIFGMAISHLGNCKNCGLMRATTYIKSSSRQIVIEEVNRKSRPLP